MGKRNQTESDHLSNLDQALTLAATEELIHGMGMVHLTTCTYMSIDELVRHVYPKLSPWRKNNLSNHLKDYDPDRQAVIMDKTGVVKVYPLEQKHIEARANKRQS